jgi:hypothetical protein
MTTGTILWSTIFFIALIWFVAWLSFLTTRAYMIGEREKEGRAREERKRLLEQLEKEFYDDADDLPKPKKRTAPQKRAVSFVDADDDDEAEAEADEPKGTYSYDPVAHKVVFIPAK